MMNGYTYILLCSDGSYYTGSTIDLQRRYNQHKLGFGANHTKKRLPVELVYVEQHPSIQLAFKREKQIQGWSKNKKKALIKGDALLLQELSVTYRDKLELEKLVS